MDDLVANTAQVEIWRERLADLGWIMKALKEDIAKRANKEDGCSGAFWEGRFKVSVRGVPLGSAWPTAQPPCLRQYDFDDGPDQFVGNLVAKLQSGAIHQRHPNHATFRRSPSLTTLDLNLDKCICHVLALLGGTSLASLVLVGQIGRRTDTLVVCIMFFALESTLR